MTIIPQLKFIIKNVQVEEKILPLILQTNIDIYNGNSKKHSRKMGRGHEQIEEEVQMALVNI